MYNELFRRTGIDAVYVAFDVHPDRADEVARAVRVLDLVGVNLTVPFKERVVPHLDRVTVAASEAGAVNTVIQVEGTLTGYNTDGEGLVRSLEATGGSLRGRRVVILGAGGTARAVASALLDRGVASVSFFNRTVARAEAAIGALKGQLTAASLRAWPLSPQAFAEGAEGADLVVNCTSGPAAPLVASLDASLLAGGADWVDANYWMEEPPQRARCEALGHRFHEGHAMLMHQGALAFELFTGHPVEVSELRDILGLP